MVAADGWGCDLADAGFIELLGRREGTRPRRAAAAWNVLNEGGGPDGRAA